MSKDNGKKKRADKTIARSHAGNGGLIAGLEDALNEAESLVDNFAGRATDSVHFVQKNLTRGIKTVRSSLHGAHLESVTDAKSALKATRHYVREHPWHIAALALAIGAAALPQVSSRIAGIKH
jgi:ElaB/YqjD/DUF883 family membrane-anchored ribosome-binding protein